MKKKLVFLSVLISSIWLSSSCVQQHQHEESQPVLKSAVCLLYPTEGNSTNGVVRFTPVTGGIRVTVKVMGLTPGNHGFHIHQYGDCSAANGTSAGGHFNPEGHDHAGPSMENRHVGDLGNIIANADSVAEVEFVDSLLTMHGANSIIGRGIIVHANEDDLMSQPTGAAGPRVACGVIGLSDESE